MNTHTEHTDPTTRALIALVGLDADPTTPDHVRAIARNRVVEATHTRCDHHPSWRIEGLDGLTRCALCEAAKLTPADA
jgi:hypothetical protein